MSHSDCKRCGARYRDEHTCEDVAELADLRQRIVMLEVTVNELLGRVRDLELGGPPCSTSDQPEKP